MPSTAPAQASDARPISILFCCLGAICRSPMARATFCDVVKRRGIEDRFGRIEYCAIGAYHVGEPADDRSIAVCRQNKVPISGRARQIQAKDFQEFDHILAMDASILRSLNARKPSGGGGGGSGGAEVRLFGDFDDGRPIQDPYYGGDEGFQKSFEQCVRYSEALLRHLGFDDA